MAEPHSTGTSLIVGAIVASAPLAGDYAVIVFASLAGALWPLSAAAGITRVAGAMLVARLVMTSSALTGFVARMIEQQYDIPMSYVISPVAFAIAMFGDNWRTVAGVAASLLVARVKAFITGSDPSRPTQERDQ